MQFINSLFSIGGGHILHFNPFWVTINYYYEKVILTVLTNIYESRWNCLVGHFQVIRGALGGTFLTFLHTLTASSISWSNFGHHVHVRVMAFIPHTQRCSLWEYIPAKIQLSHSMYVCILICDVHVMNSFITYMKILDRQIHSHADSSATVKVA